MWAQIYNTLSAQYGTPLEPVAGWLIRALEPINQFVYAVGLTDCKPLSEMTVDDFLGN